MPALNLYTDYTREEVHEIFSPDTTFTSQAGTWGLQGIVRVPERSDDFVFFVTYGQEQGEHVFDEGITEDGVLTWQTQPSQGLDNPQIRKFIAHDELVNTIYLFLRTTGARPYTYLGKLKYLSHDAQREHPVYFQWQVLDWDVSPELLQRMGLTLIASAAGGEEPPAPPGQGLIMSDPPTPHERSGIPTNEFRRRGKIDYSGRDARNRTLGVSGERLVIGYERGALIAIGRADLADRVRHVSEIEGDGAGYDVESYTPDGQVKYIEVKTTRGPANSAFFMSPNELEFARAHPGSYHLYRVYDLSPAANAGRFYDEARKIEDAFRLTPAQYRVELTSQ